MGKKGRSILRPNMLRDEPILDRVEKGRIHWQPVDFESVQGYQRQVVFISYINSSRHVDSLKQFLK